MGDFDHYGFDGLTVGATPTAAMIVSDLGKAALTVNGSTRVVVDGAKAHSGQAIGLNSAGATYTIFRLGIPGAAASVTKLSMSFYLYPEQAADQGIVDMRTESDGAISSLLIASTSAKLRIMNGLTTVGESSAAVTLNALSRIDWWVDTAGSAGARTCVPGSNTPYASCSATGITWANSAISRLNFGNVSSIAGVNMAYDDVQLETDRTTFLSDWVSRLATPTVTITGITPSIGSNGTATVTWPAVAGAASYSAHLASTMSPAQGDFTQVAATVTSPYTFTDLSVGPKSFGIKTEA